MKIEKFFLFISIIFLLISFEAFSSTQKCSILLNEISLSEFSYENQDILTFLCEQVEEQEGEGRVKKEGVYSSYLVLFNNLYTKMESKPRTGETRMSTRNRLIAMSKMRGQVFLRELKRWIKANHLESEIILEEDLNKKVFLGFHMKASFKGLARLIKAHENKNIADKFKPLVLWKDAR